MPNDQPTYRERRERESRKAIEAQEHLDRTELATTLRNFNKENITPASRIESGRSAKHWTDYVNAGVLVVTAVVGVWALIIANYQRVTMQGQLSSMNAGLRPWLAVVPKIEKPITFLDAFGQKTVHISVHYGLKVVGPTPARNVTVAQSISRHPGGASSALLNEPLAQLCRDAERNAESNDIAGLTIFPSEIKFLEGRARTSPVYQSDERILFSVQGCVDYTYGEASHGKAAFRMVLGKIGAQFWEGLQFKRSESLADRSSVESSAILEKSGFDFKEDPSGGNYVQ